MTIKTEIIPIARTAEKTDLNDRNVANLTKEQIDKTRHDLAVEKSTEHKPSAMQQVVLDREARSTHWILPQLAVEQAMMASQAVAVALGSSAVMTDPSGTVTNNSRHHDSVHHDDVVLNDSQKKAQRREEQLNGSKPKEEVDKVGGLVREEKLTVITRQKLDQILAGAKESGKSLDTKELIQEIAKQLEMTPGELKANHYATFAEIMKDYNEWRENNIVFIGGRVGEHRSHFVRQDVQGNAHAKFQKQCEIIVRQLDYEGRLNSPEQREMAEKFQQKLQNKEFRDKFQDRFDALIKEHKEKFPNQPLDPEKLANRLIKEMAKEGLIPKELVALLVEKLTEIFAEEWAEQSGSVPIKSTFQNSISSSSTDDPERARFSKAIRGGESVDGEEVASGLTKAEREILAAIEESQRRKAEEEKRDNKENQVTNFYIDQLRDPASCNQLEQEIRELVSTGSLTSPDDIYYELTSKLATTQFYRAGVTEEIPLEIQERVKDVISRVLVEQRQKDQLHAESILKSAFGEEYQDQVKEGLALLLKSGQLQSDEEIVATLANGIFGEVLHRDPRAKNEVERSLSNYISKEIKSLREFRNVVDGDIKTALRRQDFALAEGKLKALVEGRQLTDSQTNEVLDIEDYLYKGPEVIRYFAAMRADKLDSYELDEDVARIAWHVADRVYYPNVIAKYLLRKENPGADISLDDIGTEAHRLEEKALRALCEENGMKMEDAQKLIYTGELGFVPQYDSQVRQVELKAVLTKLEGIDAEIANNLLETSRRNHSISALHLAMTDMANGAAPRLAAGEKLEDILKEKRAILEIKYPSIFATPEARERYARVFEPEFKRLCRESCMFHLVILKTLADPKNTEAHDQLKAYGQSLEGKSANGTQELNVRFSQYYNNFLATMTCDQIDAREGARHAYFGGQTTKPLSTMEIVTGGMLPRNQLELHYRERMSHLIKDVTASAEHNVDLYSYRIPLGREYNVFMQDQGRRIDNWNIGNDPAFLADFEKFFTDFPELMGDYKVRNDIVKLYVDTLYSHGLEKIDGGKKVLEAVDSYLGLGVQNTIDRDTSKEASRDNLPLQSEIEVERSIFLQNRYSQSQLSQFLLNQIRLGQTQALSFVSVEGQLSLMEANLLSQNLIPALDADVAIGDQVRWTLCPKTKQLERDQKVESAVPENVGPQNKVVPSDSALDRAQARIDVITSQVVSGNIPSYRELSFMYASLIKLAKETSPEDAPRVRAMILEVFEVDRALVQNPKCDLALRSLAVGELQSLVKTGLEGDAGLNLHSTQEQKRELILESAKLGLCLGALDSTSNFSKSNILSTLAALQKYSLAHPEDIEVAALTLEAAKQVSQSCTKSDQELGVLVGLDADTAARAVQGTGLVENLAKALVDLPSTDAMSQEYKNSALLTLARVNQQRGQSDVAYEMMNRLDARQLDDSDLINQASRLLVDLGKPEEALELSYGLADSASQEKVLRYVAISYFEGKNGYRIENLKSDISDEGALKELQAQISTLYLEKGQFENAKAFTALTCSGSTDVAEVVENQLQANLAAGLMKMSADPGDLKRVETSLANIKDQEQLRRILTRVVLLGQGEELFEARPGTEGEVEQVLRNINLGEKSVAIDTPRTLEVNGESLDLANMPIIEVRSHLLEIVKARHIDAVSAEIIESRHLLSGLSLQDQNLRLKDKIDYIEANDPVLLSYKEVLGRLDNQEEKDAVKAQINSRLGILTGTVRAADTIAKEAIGVKSEIESIQQASKDSISLGLESQITGLVGSGKLNQTEALEAKRQLERLKEVGFFDENGDVRVISVGKVQLSPFSYLADQNQYLALRAHHRELIDEWFRSLLPVRVAYNRYNATKTGEVKEEKFEVACNGAILQQSFIDPLYGQTWRAGDGMSHLQRFLEYSKFHGGKAQDYIRSTAPHSNSANETDIFDYVPEPAIKIGIMVASIYTGGLAGRAVSGMCARFFAQRMISSLVVRGVVNFTALNAEVAGFTVTSNALHNAAYRRKDDLWTPMEQLQNLALMGTLKGTGRAFARSGEGTFTRLFANSPRVAKMGEGMSTVAKSGLRFGSEIAVVGTSNAIWQGRLPTFADFESATKTVALLRGSALLTPKIPMWKSEIRVRNTVEINKIESRLSKIESKLGKLSASDGLVSKLRAGRLEAMRENLTTKRNFLRAEIRGLDGSKTEVAGPKSSPTKGEIKGQETSAKERNVSPEKVSEKLEQARQEAEARSEAKKEADAKRQQAEVEAQAVENQRATQDTSRRLGRVTELMQKMQKQLVLLQMALTGFGAVSPISNAEVVRGLGSRPVVEGRIEAGRAEVKLEAGSKVKSEAKAETRVETKVENKIESESKQEVKKDAKAETKEEGRKDAKQKEVKSSETSTKQESKSTAETVKSSEAVQINVIQQRSETQRLNQSQSRSEQSKSEEVKREEEKRRRRRPGEGNSHHDNQEEEESHLYYLDEDGNPVSALSAVRSGNRKGRRLVQRFVSEVDEKGNKITKPVWVLENVEGM